MLFIFAKAQNCTPKNIAFKTGEQLNYDVYYNLKKLWVPAGKVRFQVYDSTLNGKTCFRLDGKGKSLKSYDYFFKVRDHYASVVDKKTLEPYKFERSVKEGGFRLYYDYRFDNDNQKAIVYSKKGDTTNGQEIDFPTCSFDVMTTVYYARCLDFSKLAINDTIPLTMMIDKEIFDDVYIRYKGRETIKGPNGKKYKCIKFSPLLVEGTIFNDGEDMTVYVTDDKNRIPIYVEANIAVGSIRAFLTTYKNLKYSLDAVVK